MKKDFLRIESGQIKSGGKKIIIEHTNFKNLIFPVISICFFTCSLEAAEDSNQLTQQKIANILRHQEDLVSSMECIYEQNTLPTTIENIRLVHQFGKVRPYERDPNRYIISEDYAKQEQMIIHYWRKGIKEKQDIIFQARHKPGETSLRPDRQIAFDGQLVRKLQNDRSNLYGSIDTIVSGHWSNENRIQPFSFLYEFGMSPYSKIVQDGKNFFLSKITWNNKECTKVSVQHPEISFQSFVLIFDDNFRLVERQDIFQMSPDPAPRIYERHNFLNYTKYTDKSGETIWFPSEAVYHYYMGNLQDGMPVEYESMKMKIKEIKFNIDIPDDKFVIEFPAGTKVSGIALVEPTSIAGKVLPELKDLTIELSKADANKAILVCFFDMQQRPSRNMINELARRANDLKQKEIIIISAQASKIDKKTLADWIKKSNVTFPIGQIQGDDEKIRFNWGVKMLPWLILTDNKHIVRSEGFALSELDEKIEKVKEDKYECDC